MAIYFNPPLADAADYPSPLIPMLPPLKFSHWIGGRSTEEDLIFSREGVCFSQGRYALAHALMKSGVTADTSVLMPSYHCRSLIEPAIFLEADVLFYPLEENLSIDTSKISDALIKAGKPVKAMVLPHYFGFPQDVLKLAKFCKLNGISLIEDCAHAYFSSVDKKPLGSFGDYSIASSRKFFPIEDGGVFVDNTSQRALDIKLKPPGFLSEIKAMAKLIINLFSSFSTVKIPSEVEYTGVKPSARDFSVNLDEKFDYGLKLFVPERLYNEGLKTSQLIVKTAANRAVVSKRKNNYNRWLCGVAQLSGVRPLFPDLLLGVVPYVFPLVIEVEPEEVFHKLKFMGVPMWRWEDLAVTECDVANNYRFSLIQLPCHQGLSDGQIDWMIAAISAATSGMSKETL